MRIVILASLLAAACATNESGRRVHAVPAPQNPPAVVASPTPHAPRATAQGQAALKQAAAMTRGGDPMGARRVLRVLLRARPDTKEAFQAGHRLARLALERKHYARAEALTRRTLVPTVAPGLAFLGWSLRAEALEGLGEFDAAVDAYQQALLASGDDADKKETATRGRARATFLDGDPTTAEHILGTSADQAKELLQQLVGPALGSRAALEALYGRVPPSSPWSAWVALRLARDMLERGELAAAAETAGLALRRGDPNVEREAREVIKTVAAWNTVKPRTVGVLLPLSGKYQGLGQAALEAVQLALGKASGVRLVVRDTRADATVAAQQARELILTHNVAALLGPIGEKETASAARVSAVFGVPHMVLSRHHGVSAAKPTVFRMRLSRAELGKGLAHYAFHTLGIKRVAILYPDDANGFRQMAGFWDEIVRLGGEVRAIESYEPGTKSFNPVVQRLVGTKSRAKRGKTRVDFDGLFIPDQSMAVRRIVPFLKYWGIQLRTTPGAVGTRKHPSVQLLGSDGWNHPTVIDPGEHLTDNAVFVAPFHAKADARADAFALAFKQRYAKQPLAFHAEVFDATAYLARSVNLASGTDHSARLKILNGLRTTNDFAGATGPIVVIGDNSLVRAPHILTVDLDTVRARGTVEEELKLRAARRQSEPTAK